MYNCIAIIVVDRYGAEMGYNGPKVPVSHRFLRNQKSGELFGYESIRGLFKKEEEFLAQMREFIQHPSGDTGRFYWYRDQS